MQYKILKASSSDFDESLEKLKERVNLNIKDGWRPQGGVSMAEETGIGGSKYQIVVQAMVKED